MNTRRPFFSWKEWISICDSLTAAWAAGRPTARRESEKTTRRMARREAFRAPFDGAKPARSRGTAKCCLPGFKNGFYHQFDRGRSRLTVVARPNSPTTCCFSSLAPANFPRLYGYSFGHHRGAEGIRLLAGAERAFAESQLCRTEARTSSLPWTRVDTSLAGLQVFLIALVYARALQFDFVLDDFPLILHNPLVLASWRSIPRFFAEGYFDRIFPNAPPNDYRPILSVWLLVNQKLWGFNPAGWHLAPIFLLSVVTLGVYVLARRIFGDRGLAFLTALVFALHPTHVETTAWIIGMNESLMAAPFMASFLCYLKARDGGSRRVGWLAA